MRSCAGIVTRPVLSGTSSKAPEKKRRCRSRAGPLVNGALEKFVRELGEARRGEDVQAVLLAARDDQPGGQVVAVLGGQEQPALVVEAGSVGPEEQRHRPLAPPRSLRLSWFNQPHRASCARHRTPLSPTRRASKALESAIGPITVQVSVGGARWGAATRVKKRSDRFGTYWVPALPPVGEDGCMTTDTRPAASSETSLDEVRTTARQIAASVESVVEGGSQVVRTRSDRPARRGPPAHRGRARASARPRSPRRSPSRSTAR